LGPVRHHYLSRVNRIGEIQIEGTENLLACRPGDGVLIAPNHSHDSNPHVMMAVGRRRAKVLFGKPIDLSGDVGQGKLRAATSKLTSLLESEIQGLMASLATW
jgi:hypothetical protein